MGLGLPRKNCSVNSRHEERPQVLWYQEIDSCHCSGILNAFCSEKHKFGCKRNPGSVGQMEATGYQKILDAACARLQALGIAVNLESGPAVTESRIRQCEQEWDVSFPPSVRQFYTELGDGLMLRWFIDRSNVAMPFGSLWVPRLHDLKVSIDSLRVFNQCFADYDFRETEQPEVAKQHYRRQLSFFPFREENSDLICIEIADGRETVVFFDHEWPCYPRGDSGLFLADSLHGFWMGWSSVGFAHPKLHWWPGTVGDRGTEWSEERFGFCLPSAEQSHAREAAAASWMKSKPHTPPA